MRMQRTSSWQPGSSQIQFTLGKTIDLPSRHAQDKPSQTLESICKEVTPECTLNPLLFNGHLQTGWAAVVTEGPQVCYKRRVFESTETDTFPGSFTVDFATGVKLAKEEDRAPTEADGLITDPAGIGHNFQPPRTTYLTDEEFAELGSEDSKPMLIVLHGLSGGSYETYVRHTVAPLVRKMPGTHGGISDGAWDAMVVNSRGCAGSKITSNYLYNARSTWEVRQIVSWARQKWPNRPLFAADFSLGANILTNYVGEEGETCILSAAVVASNPWNLEISAKALERSWIGLEVYSKTMGKHMRGLVELHKHDIMKNNENDIDIDRVCQGRYLYQFDRDLQCATWGYATEGAYYRDASCADSVLAIRIPSYALHATDDPITSKEAIPYEEIRQNPFVVLCTTSKGGHLSWFELGGGRWYAKPVEAFLNTIARDINLDAIDRPSARMFGQAAQPFQFDPIRRKASLLVDDLSGTQRGRKASVPSRRDSVQASTASVYSSDCPRLPRANSSTASGNGATTDVDTPIYPLDSRSVSPLGLREIRDCMKSLPENFQSYLRENGEAQGALSNAVQHHADGGGAMA